MTTDISDWAAAQWGLHPNSLLNRDLEEVVIHPDDPSGWEPSVELWVQTDPTDIANSVLRFRDPTTGQWSDLSSGASAPPVEEIVIQADDPSSAFPGVELWVDTDADAVVPIGGTGPTGPSGPTGDTGPTGPTGSMGVSTVIVGDFGAQTTPADLPVDGAIPVDWDGPGNPATAYQMEPGQSLYYDKPTDPLDGHLFQYVSTAVDPTGWIDVGLIQGPPGVAGPSGPTGPTGPMTDEVHIGPDTPPLPQSELWFDTDDTRILGPTDLPLGGVTYMALTKKSDLDGDVEWRDVYVMPSGKVLQFPNVAEVAKINLYSTTFGLGITSGTLNIFASSTIEFNKDSITGEVWGYVDTGGIHTVGSHFVADTDGMGLRMYGDAHLFKAVGGGPILRLATGNTRAKIQNNDGTGAADIWRTGSSNINVNWLNGFSGTCQFRVNDAVVTVQMVDVKRNVQSAENTSTKMFDWPSGVPAPWASLRMAVDVVDGWSWWENARVDFLADGVYLVCYDNRAVETSEEFSLTCTWAR